MVLGGVRSGDAVVDIVVVGFGKERRRRDLLSSCWWICIPTTLACLPWCSIKGVGHVAQGRSRLQSRSHLIAKGRENIEVKRIEGSDGVRLLKARIVLSSRLMSKLRTRRWYLELTRREPWRCCRRSLVAVECLSEERPRRSKIRV